MSAHYLDLDDLRRALADIRDAYRTNSKRAKRRPSCYTRIDRKNRVFKPLITGSTCDKSKPVQYMAHLPDDILHELCRNLRQADQIEALSALRLTCKSVVPIVNEYLFRTFHLDRTIGSVRRLIALSDTQLASHVREVKLDAEMVFAPLDHTQWSSAVSSFNNGTSYAEDSWWGRHAYEVALARERDAVSTPTALRIDRWRNYEAEIAEQQELNHVDVNELLRALQHVFRRLPLVIRVECMAYHGSKYVLPPTDPLDETVGLVRRKFLRSMALPRLVRPFSMAHRAGEDHFGAFYVAAVANASVAYSHKLEHLSFKGTSERAFCYLRTLGPNMVPRNMSLKSLLIRSFGERSLPSVVKAEIQSNMASLIWTAPNLQTLTLCVSPEPVFCGQPSFNVQSPSSPWILPQLEKLVLKQIIVHADQLRNVFEALAPTVRQVELANIELKHGSWIDVFDVLRSGTDYGCKISLQGVFVEGGHGAISFWVVGREVADNSLMSQLLEYIEKRSPRTPLRTLASGGSAAEWINASDRSLHYYPTTLDYLYARLADLVAILRG